MKKSIKYAGIAAATLLTVAPVAAPVVSQAAGTEDTTTAAATANEITNDNITTAVNALKGVMVNTTYGDNSTNGTYPTALTDAQYDTYMSAADFLALGITNGSISASNSAVLADENVDAQVKVYAVDSNNNKINSNDYTTLAAAVAKDNGSIKYAYTIKYGDKDGDAQTPLTGTFTLTNDNNYSEVKALNVSYTNPLDVAYGSKTVDTQLSSTIDGVVKDQNGNTIELDNDATTTKAGLLYKNLKAAITNDEKTDVYSDSTFGNADVTYYQPVTITLKSGKLGNDSEGNVVTAKSIVDNYLAGEDNYSVTVNGATMSAQTEASLNATDDNTLTFVREVKVSQNASWTTEKVSGVVTTKNDASYYTLQNNDNKTITNRALQPNTAWKTNAVRTDANGNKQYRVATGEWIDADSVTFVKDGDTSTSTGALTDITKVDGTATLDAGNYVYFLYNKDGKVLTNRSLMPGTAWHVINTAKDAEGNTYYRVATNEWLQQGTGVNYSNN
ncbi:SLAP domain-containing protein [Companilactobacillus sp. HBUAS59699]|uniref:SLAP domain-containing protein n=1 Tax=Companilactobacillus sp. HBUAS59699 TaxID=3109358 RepID=UPI002FEFEB06